MQRELAVTAALDTHRGDNVECRAAQHLVFFIRKGHRRGDNHRITGVHTHRVKVFHGANRDHIAGGIAHHFKFDLFPSGDAFFHQDLGNGRQTQTALGDLAQFILVFGNTAAGAAQRKRGTHDYRIPDLLSESQRILQRVDHTRRNHRLTDRLHRVFEHLAIFRFINGFRHRTQQLHIVLFQKSLFSQLHRQGQPCLSAQCGQQTVRFFLLDDPLDSIQRQRFDIHMICHGAIGHYGGRVGVDKHNLQPFFFQRAARLGAGVVKFGSLSDHDRTGPDDQNFVNVWIQRHCGSSFPFSINAIKSSNKPAVSNGPALASGWNCTENAGILV